MFKLRRLIKEWKQFSAIQKLLLVVMAALFIAGTAKAFYYTRLFGGADLRERIVGARVLNTAHSPYYYKWAPGDSEQLINPNLNRQRNISGLSVAPGTLYIHYLFSPLYYPVLRMAWFVFQYLLLGYLLLFFMRSAQQLQSKVAVVLFGVVFFACSPFWLLHIDRGQVYILYAFFFCLIYQCYKSQLPAIQFAAGLLLAAAIYCRPTFAVAALPLFFIGNRRVIFGAVAGGLTGCLFLFLNYQLWKDYLAAITAFTQVSDGLSFQASPQVEYPLVIEGMTNLRMGKIDFMTGGLLPLDARLARFGIQLPGKMYIVIYAGAILLSLFAFRKKIRQTDAVLFSLFAFLFYILTEFIMPAPRGAYNLVQWIFPVLLMLSTGRMSVMDKTVMAMGLCFIVDFPFYFPLINDVGELLLFYSIIRFLQNYVVGQMSKASL